MPKSVINKKFLFTQDWWVVSVINTGSLLKGHAAIVVEGLLSPADPLLFNKTKLYIAQYDIMAAVDEKKQDSCINAKGYIDEIRCFKNEQCTRDYSKYQTQSYLAQAEDVKKMIASIEKDKLRTKQAVENVARFKRNNGCVSGPEKMILDEKGDPVAPLKFQFLGKNHPIVSIFGDKDEGDNCAGWCIEKLVIARVGDEKDIPKPKLVAGSCVIS